MLEAFSSTTSKQEYAVLDRQINTQLREVYSKITTHEQLESRIFHFLDAELCTRRTPFEARNYKKLIKSLLKTQLVARHFIDTLIKKTNRFTDKQSVAKEKENLRKSYRDAILTQNTKQFVSS
jgi:hypothetical protein